ncbi:MAG: hypothetical protein V4632_14675 [Pseudomonadota bacterium]
MPRAIEFILHGLAPDIPMQTIFKGVLPFVVADLMPIVIPHQTNY